MHWPAREYLPRHPGGRRQLPNGGLLLLLWDLAADGGEGDPERLALGGSSDPTGWLHLSAVYRCAVGCHRGDTPIEVALSPPYLEDAPQQDGAVGDGGGRIHAREPYWQQH